MKDTIFLDKACIPNIYLGKNQRPCLSFEHQNQTSERSNKIRGFSGSSGRFPRLGIGRHPVEKGLNYDLLWSRINPGSQKLNTYLPYYQETRIFESLPFQSVQPLEIHTATVLAYHYQRLFLPLSAFEHFQSLPRLLKCF